MIVTASPEAQSEEEEPGGLRTSGIAGSPTETAQWESTGGGGGPAGARPGCPGSGLRELLILPWFYEGYIYYFLE